MLIECSIALVSAWRAHSPALLAFGADSFVELLSATVVLLQFVPAISLSKPGAARLAGILLFVLAGGITVISVVALIGGVEPDPSWLGIGVTVAALIAMPLLSGAKRRAARRLRNSALAADAVQSATCAYLAAITLFGLALNAAFNIPWIDPAAALVAVPIICLEGRRTLRGEVCGCC
ncbi:MAG: cation transporter [Candidatus Methylomirabilota bacterium]